MSTDLEMLLSAAAFSAVLVGVGLVAGYLIWGL